ncbi:hypothetical protein DdX_19156 [Ditylenchus destructor]|uniref:Uncharacterized protein n=1 Tax=Ditylenchus destructor TaxID=166010 RepID=A0AAD4MN62_9BILA|nr:hypothetical protein DdX_19156 [Ditylenchus destructor]
MKHSSHRVLVFFVYVNRTRRSPWQSSKPSWSPSVVPPALASLPSIPSLNITLPPLPTGVPLGQELEKLIETLIALLQVHLFGAALPTGVPTAVPSVGVPSA